MKRARFTEDQIIGVLKEHSALGYLTPAAYAANLSATLRNPDQLRRSHVAQPAPNDVNHAEALIAAG